ncbi:unnamed protein product [Mytilus coruscus]|uniref:Uncharacterized protein n=1 Tax=Mytilus coruscus TaxID=42192 RepID=A0A6J8AXI4_MYTCO|nr:unnamed protein product [Mytilus coruscus]
MMAGLDEHRVFDAFGLPMSWEESQLDAMITTEDFFPFSNKLEMLLVMLRGSKFHMIDQGTMKFFIYICEVIIREEIKVIPSFETIWNYDFKGVQHNCDEMTDSNSQPFTVVKPSEVIRNVLLNKKYSELIERYPRKQHYFSNQNTGKKWTEEMASPSAMLREDLYFIGDKVKCRIEGEIVPGEIKKFYHKEDGDALFVDVHMHLEYDASQDLFMEIPIVSEEWCTIPLSAIECKIEDSKMENIAILKENAGGRPVIHMPVNVFIDDTSGNKSRKWNPYHLWTVQMAGLPNRYKQQKHYHHFLTVSNKVSIMDIGKPIIDDINDLCRNGKIMFDVLQGREVLVTSQLALVETDNMMAVSACKLKGPAAQQNCRICIVCITFACHSSVNL